MKCYEISWKGIIEGIGLHKDEEGRACAKVAGPWGEGDWPAQYAPICHLTPRFREKLEALGGGSDFSVQVCRVRRCDVEVTSAVWLMEEREPSTDVLVHININSHVCEPVISVSKGEIFAVTYMPLNGSFIHCKSAFVRLERGGTIVADSVGLESRLVRFRSQKVRIPNGYEVHLDDAGELTKIGAREKSAQKLFSVP